MCEEVVYALGQQRTDPVQEARISKIMFSILQVEIYVRFQRLTSCSYMASDIH